MMAPGYVTCPRCGAGRDERCRTAHGRVVRAHPERRRVAVLALLEMGGPWTRTEVVQAAGYRGDAGRMWRTLEKWPALLRLLDLEGRVELDGHHVRLVEVAA